MSLFRVYRNVASAPTQKGAPAARTDAALSYLDRLLKLIPGEIVAFHTTFVPLVDKEMAGDPKDHCIGHSLLFVLAIGLLVGLRSQLTRGSNPSTGPQWPAVLVAAGAYILWVWHTATGPFACFDSRVYPVITLMIIATYVTVVPWIYKGDEA